MSDFVGGASVETGPLVTVAMPIYNAGAYLRLAVLSIVKQTEANWELLIIDDGSTDNALDSIREIEDHRIRIFRDGANKGLAARLNEAIDLARGKYFARMDQDDVSYPERFAMQLKELQDDNDLDLVATRAILIDENNRALGLFPCAISHEAICVHPWKGFYFPHPTWMGRIEWFRKYRYAEPAPYFCEDQELLLRSYKGSQFGTVPSVLLAYRIRSNTNWQKLAKTRHAVFAAQLRNFSDSNQWFFLLLAVVALIGKRIGDVARRIGGGSFLPGGNILIDAEVIKWRSILETLSAEK